MCYDNIYVIWVSLLDNKLFQLLKQKGLKKDVIREDKAAEVSDLETIHTEKVYVESRVIEYLCAYLDDQFEDIDRVCSGKRGETIR